jgi:hypothetical protein
VSSAASRVFLDLTRKPLQERITWADVRAGDEISFLVIDNWEGLTRCTRRVLAVNWPIITLEGERVYEFDASKPARMTPDVRRPADSQASPE